MSRGHGVHGHTRSGADDESRTRGLGHGVAALCLLSYIRRFCETTIGQYRGRFAANCQRASSKRKRPGTFRIPGLCEQSLEGARLGAPFSRIQWALAPIKAIARRNSPVHRHRCEQRDERNQPLQGSVGSNDVVRFHGAFLWFWLWLLRAGFSMGADCKDSLPDASTPCENGV